MKFHALILALGGLVGAAAIAQAQTAAPPDPLSDAQAAFGKIVGDAFHAPDPVIDAPQPAGAPGPALGGALRTSLEVPGAAFAGVMKPFADADAAANPAPAPAPGPVHHRHARVHHRHAPA